MTKSERSQTQRSKGGLRTSLNLHDLLAGHRVELMEMWSEKISAMLANESLPNPGEIMDHVPDFVAQIAAALAPSALPLPEGTYPNAEQHGLQRFRLGFNLGEVIREYGTLVSCIVKLASARGLAITNPEFAILSTHVIDGIVDAVSQYVWQRDLQLQRQAAEHIGFIAHELRNPLATARLALGILRGKELSAGGRVVDMLDRSLVRETDLIETAMTQAWLNAGAPARTDRLVFSELSKEVMEEAAIEAEHKAVALVLEAEPDIVVEGDRRMLRSVMTNLIQNAIKFTSRGGRVTVRAHTRPADAGVQIEVEDCCGGLPPGAPEQLFQSFVQKGQNRSGAGLGLAIVKQAVEAHRGTIEVRDLPKKGCVFSIHLPGRPAP